MKAFGSSPLSAMDANYQWTNYQLATVHLASCSQLYQWHNEPTRSRFPALSFPGGALAHHAMAQLTIRSFADSPTSIDAEQSLEYRFSFGQLGRVHCFGDYVCGLWR